MVRQCELFKSQQLRDWEEWEMHHAMNAPGDGKYYLKSWFRFVRAYVTGRGSLVRHRPFIGLHGMSG